MVLKNVNQWFVQNENEVTDILNLPRLYGMISLEVWRKELANGLSDRVNMSESGGPWAAWRSLNGSKPVRAASYIKTARPIAENSKRISKMSPDFDPEMPIRKRF